MPSLRDMLVAAAVVATEGIGGELLLDAIEDGEISQSISSSAMTSVTYHFTSGMLALTFHNGSTYSWEGVPPSVVLGLLDASSPGSYFVNNIRGQY